MGKRNVYKLDANMHSGVHSTAKIHPTANIEPGVTIGSHTSVWDNVHIRKNASIGDECIIGEKSYIAYDVKIGNGVKINSFVYICAGVTVEDQVMISAGTIFTNDLLPRAFDPDGSMKTSEPTEETLNTTVERGATIGAGAILGPGIRLGRYSMIGMGATVTRDVPPHHLVYGNPARFKGITCTCGMVVWQGEAPKRLREKGSEPGPLDVDCPKCGRKYTCTVEDHLWRVFERDGLLQSSGSRP